MTINKLTKIIKEKWQIFSISALIIFILQLVSSKVILSVLVAILLSALIQSPTISPKKSHQEIIIAPHTYYIADKDLRDAVAYPLEYELESDDNVLYWQPKVTISSERDSIIERCKFARQIATLCEFPNDKQVKKITQQLNTCIRGRIDIDDITQEALAHDNNVDVNVYRLWKLVQSIKHDMFDLIERFDDVECYIEDEVCDHEGYVIVNEFGTFKIIDREYFSCANFNRVR